MRKLIMSKTVTLDGLYAGLDDSLEHVGPTHEEHQFANDQIRAASGIVFGRRTYQTLVPFWDTYDVRNPANNPVEVEFATIFRTKPRIVVSRTLDQVDDKATLVRDNVAEEIARLKQQPGADLVLACGADLLATLLKLGLIDELELLIKPTVLGRGRPLFENVVDVAQLKLIGMRLFESGSVLVRYRL
jgi:dihydrofolate reductase